MAPPIRMPALGRTATGCSGTTVLARISTRVGTTPARMGTAVHHERRRSEPVIAFGRRACPHQHHQRQERCGQPQRTEYEADHQGHRGQLHDGPGHRDEGVAGPAQLEQLDDQRGRAGQHDQQCREQRADQDGGQLGLPVARPPVVGRSGPSSPLR